MRATTFIWLGLLAIAATVSARPPRADGYARHDELRVVLSARMADLGRKEEFERKPLIEKYLIKYREGAEEFDGFKLDGKKLVEKVIAWDMLQKPKSEVDPAHLEVLMSMPDVLHARYKGLDINKKDRYETSRPLVDALTHARLHIREAAIEALKRIYRNTGLFYQPDLPPNERKDKQKDWKSHITREKRR